MRNGFGTVPKGRTTFVAIAAILSLVAAPWMVWRQYERSFYTGLMPEKLELGPRFWHDSDSYIFSGCGIAAFSLSDTTLTAIQRQGLDFLADVKGERNGKRGERFSKWQPTPVPGEWFSNGVPVSFHCARWLGAPLMGQALAAMRAPGSYYATEIGADMMVFPAIGVVMLAYTD